MGELWRKVFFTMTRGMDLQETLVKSSFLAIFL